jgi:flagellar motility protein MotE (MotC chaperone)
MIRTLRDFRLVPIVLFATISLFALKTIGLIIDGHYTLDESRPADDDITGTVPGAPGGLAREAAGGRGAGKPSGAQSGTQTGTQSGKQSWAQQMFNYPDVTGAVGEEKKEATPAAAPPKGKAKVVEEPPADAQKGWKPIPLEGNRAQSPAELAVLERLAQRRSEIEARAKELEMRESLLKAAEKRLEGRVSELKDLEARISNSAQQREEGDLARFKNVVTMYEAMKPKEAAKIFDRLDLKILVDVAKEINPRRMSDILAQMSPDAAQQLTVELAARNAPKEKPTELPKIEGRPTN